MRDYMHDLNVAVCALLETARKMQRSIDDLDTCCLDGEWEKVEDDVDNALLAAEDLVYALEVVCRATQV